MVLTANILEGQRMVVYMETYSSREGHMHEDHPCCGHKGVSGWNCGGQAGLLSQGQRYCMYQKGLCGPQGCHWSWLHVLLLCGHTGTLLPVWGEMVQLRYLIWQRLPFIEPTLPLTVTCHLYVHHVYCPSF